MLMADCSRRFETTLPSASCVYTCQNPPNSTASGTGRFCGPWARLRAQHISPDTAGVIRIHPRNMKTRDQTGLRRFLVRPRFSGWSTVAE